jgi:hypothetical protein
MRRLPFPAIETESWRFGLRDEPARSAPGGVVATELLASNCNLDRKNPRAKEDIAHLLREQFAATMLEKEPRIAEIMVRIQKLLAESGDS